MMPAKSLSLLRLLLSALWLPAIAGAQEAPRLSELAATADLVAVAQVIDTDYQYTREFPSGGTAFLRILIPYKVTRPLGDLVEVYEEGLHPHECYFPNPSVAEEGRRYLVFLRINPERQQQYLGQSWGCALEVLVNSDNEYALRFPPHLAGFSAELQPWAQPMTFGDQYAVPSNEQIDVSERNRLLEGDWLRRRDDGRYEFTHGVPMPAVRGLLGADNLTLDRNLLRPAAE